MVAEPTIVPQFRFSWKTMPENLSEAGISWKVYQNKTLGPINNTTAGLGGFVNTFKQASDPKSDLARYGIAPTYPEEFTLDVALNRLPKVSWVVPNFLETEHPAFPVAVGAVGIVNVLRILISNPKVWEKTAVIVSYDENGGFFDHVSPPTPPPGTLGEFIPNSVDITKVEQAGGIRGPIGLGFRVPCFVISPYSRGGLVASDVFDHTSQLKLIAERFNVPVPNITAWRDSIVGDLTSAFNFTAPPNPTRPDLGQPILRMLPKLPQCVPNAFLGNLQLGVPYPVPYPQTMPGQATTPARGTPSGPCV